ncbi:MAG: class I SAM-dependent RNA methyltransferase [Bacteriovoracia bacterium]
MPVYFATCPWGTEKNTEKEILALGGTSTQIKSGGVFFEGSLETLYKANLWLRTSTRILFPLKTFSSKNQTMLYSQVTRIHWEKYFGLDHTFRVDVTVSKRKEKPKFEMPSPPEKTPEQNTIFAAQKVKDAIVDRFRRLFGQRPNVAKTDPSIVIHAHFEDGKCMVSLDSSGVSLHERGYRKQTGVAPLKENLGAAILMESTWNPDVPFYDLMCGSGTFLFEAALMSQKIAPAYLRCLQMRTPFLFMNWLTFDEKIWEKVFAEAEKYFLEGQKQLAQKKPKIFGFDADDRILKVAERNSANLQSRISFRHKRIEQWLSTEELSDQMPAGVVVCNPPYGERLSSPESMNALYKTIGDVLKKRFKGSTAYVFSGNLEALKHIGLKPKRKVKLFNGPIECRLLEIPLY